MTSFVGTAHWQMRVDSYNVLEYWVNIYECFISVFYDDNDMYHRNLQYSA